MCYTFWHLKYPHKLNEKQNFFVGVIIIMMEKIQTAANSITVKVIFTLIILSFIFAGMGRLFTTGKSVDNEFVAKVNGIGISRVNYENAVSNAIQQYKLNQNQPEVIAALREGILKQQIDSQLLYQYAKHLDIMPTNDQIKDFIRHQRYFLEDGQFNNNRYLTILAENHLTPDAYAESIRELLRQQQFLQMVVYSDFVLPVENEIAPLFGQKRQIQTAMLSPEDLGITKVRFSEKEMKSYYENHASLFTLPTDQMKLQFVQLSRQEIEKQMQISEAMLLRYYQNHHKDYQIPAKVAYSVIETKDRATATELYKQLQQGKVFAELAAQHSIYPMQRQNKGQLGWFEPNNLPAALKIADLKRVGEFSGPLQQEDGHYLLVRLDKKQATTIPPLTAIKKQVEDDLRQSLLDTELQKTQNHIQSLVDQGLSMQEIAKQLKVPLQKSNWLTQRDKPLSYSVLAEQILPDAQEKGKTAVIGPIYVDETQELYVAQVTEFRRSGLMPFSAVSTDIQQRMQAEEQHKRFVKATKRLLADLAQKKAAAVKKVHFSAPVTINRMDPKMDPNAVNTVYRLVPPIGTEAVYGITYLPNGKAIIVSLLHAENNAPEKSIEGALFYQGAIDTEQSLINALLLKAAISVAPIKAP